MIPVLLGPEPPDFDQSVRQPGLHAIQAAGCSPSDVISRGQLNRAVKATKSEHWRRARLGLRSAFNGCCAYSCFYLEEALAPSGADLSGSVDHFRPISRAPSALAYEWSNLHWAWRLIDNDYKRDKLVPLDPCVLAACPFSLDPGDFGHLYSRAGLSDQQRRYAQETLEALGLNQAECVLKRQVWSYDFMLNAVDYGDHLMRRWQPFLWQELKSLGAIP